MAQNSWEDDPLYQLLADGLDTQDQTSVSDAIGVAHARDRRLAVLGRHAADAPGDPSGVATPDRPPPD